MATPTEVVGKVAKGLLNPEQARAALAGYDPQAVQAAVLDAVATAGLSPAVARLLLPTPKAPKANGLTLKVSEKKAVSVYGLGRFPLTLYAGQWERLLDHAEHIRQFIAEYRGELSFKE